ASTESFRTSCGFGRMKPRIARSEPNSGPRRQKRGGFVGSGPPKPPFAPMRGGGEGEKRYEFLLNQSLVRHPFATGYNLLFVSLRWLRCRMLAKVGDSSDVLANCV